MPRKPEARILTLGPDHIPESPDPCLHIDRLSFRPAEHREEREARMTEDEFRAALTKAHKLEEARKIDATVPLMTTCADHFVSQSGHRTLEALIADELPYMTGGDRDQAEYPDIAVWRDRRLLAIVRMSDQPGAPPWIIRFDGPSPEGAGS